MGFRDIDRHSFYAGKPQPSAKSAGHFESIDPSNGNPICKIFNSPPPSIDAAIQSAQAAFPSWSSTPPIERARILQRAVALLREYNDDLARIETLDTGKPFSETSTVDIVTGADVLEYFANLIASGGAQRGVLPPPPLRFRVHVQGSPGRVRWHRRVELPHPDRPLEVRAVPGGRKLHGLQAERVHATARRVSGRHISKGRRSGRCLQCRVW